MSNLMLLTNLILELKLDSNVNALYAVMAFTGAIIVLIILLANLSNNHSIDKNLIFIFSWVIFFCIQDGVWGIFASHAIKNDTGLMIASYIFHLSAILSSLFWTLYYLSRVKTQIKKGWIFILISAILTLIQICMLFGNLFGSEFMFYVDENGLYTTTDYRKIMFYMQFAEYLVIATVFFFATIKSKKENNRRTYFAAFVVSVAPIFFGAFQMIYPDAPYDSLGFAVACLIIHSFLVIDYEKQVFDLKQLKEELNDALEKAEAANNAKTTFLFSMSHDIRTPMNAIMGYTEMSKKHINEPDLVKDYLNKIDISSNQLLMLINQVLEMARIENGNINLSNKETNLLELNNVLNVIFLDQAVLKDINFTISTKNLEHPNVLIDINRLEQVINNILSNAFKYTLEGGTVKYSLEELPCEKDGYGLYSFIVSDTGIGMSEEFLNNIYDEFARENTSTVSKIQGTGLGMSIVKRLTDLFEGSIEIQSKKNVGTTIKINIPMRINNEVKQMVDENLEDEIKLDGLKVLLVEDNELNQEIAVEILSEYNIVIDTANDGDIAVEKIKNSKVGQYDLVLMDVQMPRMNGYEATKAIRALENEIANIPIIAMTANAFEEDVQNAINAGMNGHLSKPIDISKLIKTLIQFKN